MGESDAAAVFYGRGAWGRLAIALPAVLRAAWLLMWPASLSADYGPQVIPARTGFSLEALLGFCIVVLVPALALWCRRRAPAISFAAALAALSYVPTANLFFSSGVVLAERNLYLAVVLPAAFVGAAATWLASRRGARQSAVAAAILVVAAGARSFARLPAWQDNRSQLLTLLAGVQIVSSPRVRGGRLAGLHDTAGARRVSHDRLRSLEIHLTGAHAIF